MKILPSLRTAAALSGLVLALLPSARAADASTPAPMPATAPSPTVAASAGRGQPQPQPPTRSPDAPSAPKFTRLEGQPGVNPPADANGNFVIGPEYIPAPESKVIEGVPQGKIAQFSMDSKDSKFYNPGISRTQLDPATGTYRDIFGTVDPNNPKTLVVQTRSVDFQRAITVYIPAQYVPGTEVPFIVSHDGPGMARADGAPPRSDLARVLDNLIAQKRVPLQVAIMIQNGGGDAQGNERGREYDMMSGKFAEFIEAEVLPLVEKNYNIKLTKNPEGRATMGNSSGGSAALIMAWYHPEWYRRVLTTSGTFVNQQWPYDPATPGGAWEFHNSLIPQSPKKPIRLFMAAGDHDLLNPNVMRDDMHDWVEANHRMAKVLAAKGYDYQYIFCLNAGHSVGNAKAQFLPEALEWLWKGYPIAGASPAAKP